jgi:hypothetical protein
MVERGDSDREIKVKLLFLMAGIRYPMFLRSMVFVGYSYVDDARTSDPTAMRHQKRSFAFCVAAGQADPV